PPVASRSTMTTFAPRPAKPNAVARPMPLLPPVTSAILSLNSMVRSSSTKLLATVTQARGDAIDAEMDALHDLGRGVAGAMAAQQLDLHVVQRVDVGKAVADRGRQQRVGLEQGVLARDRQHRVHPGLPLPA